MSATPTLVLNLLAIAGATVANTLIGYGWEGNIAQIVSVIVINLGTLMFWGAMNLIQKMGVSLHAITAVIQAVEEQAADKPNDQKLAIALSLLDDELAKTNMNPIMKMFFKPFAKILISGAAKPLKGLLYATPPVKSAK